MGWPQYVMFALLVASVLTLSAQCIKSKTTSTRTAILTIWIAVLWNVLFATLLAAGGFW